MALRPAPPEGGERAPARADDAIRVVVADDYAPMRIGLRAVLEEGGFDVCAEAEDAPGAIEATVRERPDLCVLDIKMPGNGISAAAAINARVPETEIVMLTVSRDMQDFLDSMQAGASAYLLKETDARRLPAVLRGVLEGESALPNALLRHLLATAETRERRGKALDSLGIDLTAREREVVDLLSQGLTTKQIAKRLFVEPVTVRSHVLAVVRKLGVPDRDAAVELLRSLENKPVD